MRAKPVPSGRRPDVPRLIETFMTVRVTDVMRHAIITRAFRGIESDISNRGRQQSANGEVGRQACHEARRRICMMNAAARQIAVMRWLLGTPRRDARLWLVFSVETSGGSPPLGSA